MSGCACIVSRSELSMILTSTPRSHFSPRRVSRSEVFRRGRFNQLFQRGLRSVYMAEPLVRHVLAPDVSRGDHGHYPFLREMSVLSVRISVQRVYHASAEVGSPDSWVVQADEYFFFFRNVFHVQHLSLQFSTSPPWTRVLRVFPRYEKGAPAADAPLNLLLRQKLMR